MFSQPNVDMNYLENFIETPSQNYSDKNFDELKKALSSHC